MEISSAKSHFFLFGCRILGIFFRKEWKLINTETISEADVLVDAIFRAFLRSFLSPHKFLMFLPVCEVH